MEETSLHRSLDYQLIQKGFEGIEMGEVRVAVTLTNPMDQAMVREGFKPESEVRRLEVDALVDTGAVNCVVPSRIADTLGLARVFKQTARYADGREESVDVTEPVLFEIMGRKVFEECLVLGDEVLIGQTALESTDLFVDCRSGRVVPNPDRPDRPVINIRRVTLGCLQEFSPGRDDCFQPATQVAGNQTDNELESRRDDCKPDS